VPPVVESNGQDTLFDAPRTAPVGPAKLGPTYEIDRYEVPRRVGGNEVTPAEAELAAGCLDAFNEKTGNRFRGTRWLKQIICRIHEHPEMDLAAHKRVMKSTLRRKWWRGRATPNVVWSQTPFEVTLYTVPDDDEQIRDRFARFDAGLDEADDVGEDARIRARVRKKYAGR
jgi:hypothetical protein